jgi:hypothetical protein
LKRLLVLVATAGLAVGLYAATAGGGQQAVTPGQFAALKKSVVKLQKDVKTLNSVVGSCLFVQAVPIARYGGNSTEGYVYGKADGSGFFTSALDIVTGQNETPQYWVVGTTPDCASGMNSGSALKSFKVDPSARSVATLRALLNTVRSHRR